MNLASIVERKGRLERELQEMTDEIIKSFKQSRPGQELTYLTRQSGKSAYNMAALNALLSQESVMTARRSSR